MRGNAHNVVWERGKLALFHEDLINSIFGMDKDAVAACATPRILKLTHFVIRFGDKCLYKGKIIREKMLRCMSKMETNDIPFGVLITKFCEIFGVDSTISYSILRPMEELVEESIVDIAQIFSKCLNTGIDEENEWIKNRNHIESPDDNDLRREIEFY
uniref:Uncharacterized protein n=1 Tax=Antirrhinum hispanicum TaxID=49039 RepID=Q9AXC7_ANTHI|nr:hypothetical protein [Antirrhinum hispanicum]